MQGDDLAIFLGIIIALAASSVAVRVGLSMVRRRRL